MRGEIPSLSLKCGHDNNDGSGNNSFVMEECILVMVVTLDITDVLGAIQVRDDRFVFSSSGALGV